MKIYKNPFVSRECYFVKTGKAYTHKREATASKGYQVQFWDGKWEVKEAQYYDFSLRDEMPIVAENRTSIQSVIERAILNAVLDLVGETKIAHPTEKGKVQWSRQEECPITPEQFEAIYADDTDEKGGD